MRFTVVTFGSEGDTRPLVALCRGLMDAGHEVCLFAEQSTLAYAELQRVPAQALAGDMKGILPINDPSHELQSDELRQTIQAGIRVVNDNTSAWMQVIADHARTSDAILFSSLAMLIGPAVAAGLNKPAMGLFFQPMTATREFASPMLPPGKLPAWLNRFSYRGMRWLMWRFSAKAIKAAYQQVFGRPLRHSLQHDYPMLYGFSSHLVQRPYDWPALHQVCGHWSLPTRNVHPPSQLLEFIAKEPPIYVGFGSASSFIRQSCLQEIITAVEGRPVVFYPGWSQISAKLLPKNFFVLPEIPHEWLFPRMSVVIHHGGAGTTHTAAQAGVPNIVLPIAADQFFWASRLHAAGVAPAAVRADRITAAALSDMIRFTERDEVRARAKALGAAMATETGVTIAVREIVARITAW